MTSRAGSHGDGDGMRSRLKDKQLKQNDKGKTTSPISRADASSDETSFKVVREVFLPFLSAGLGMVGAGLILERVQYWTVFKQIPQFFILVPALIGLKGNLEMTLASRLSTEANLGSLDTMSAVAKLGGANLALIQLQGVVVGALAAVIAVLMSLASQAKVQVVDGLVLLTSSVITASITSFSLGLVMVLVIAVSRRVGVNPDNVATPVAASLGDLITLVVLSNVAAVLHAATSLWPHLVILALYVAVARYCHKIASFNVDTKPVLDTGWSPVLAAMVISSAGGAILNGVITAFPNIALFQPVINGVAGNLVGIQSSRISTELHRRTKLAEMPAELETCNFVDPRITFAAEKVSSSDIATKNSVAARVLLMLVVPGHMIFNLAIAMTQGYHLFSFSFLALYFSAAFIQVAVLLHICNCMVMTMWRRGTNPDNAAIPYLTALGDVSGGALLAVVFNLIS